MKDGSNLTVEELEAQHKALTAAAKELYSKIWNGNKRDEEAFQRWRDLSKVQNDVYHVLFRAKFYEEHASELERKFTDTYQVATEEINVKLAESYAALEEACRLSEKYGIPFSSAVVFNGDNYWPKSLKERWGAIGAAPLKEYFQFHELYPGYLSDYTEGYGWVTSYC